MMSYYNEEHCDVMINTALNRAAKKQPKGFQRKKVKSLLDKAISQSVSDGLNGYHDDTVELMESGYLVRATGGRLFVFQIKRLA